MTEGNASIFDGCHYTVEQRLETFKDSHWPYDRGTCTTVKMAEAGFYYCGTSETPDWVRCVVCHHELDGWEEEDEPLEEHRRHRPDCPFVKKIRDPYEITVGQALELEKEATKCYIKKEGKKLEDEAYAMWDKLKMALYKVMDELEDNN